MTLRFQPGRLMTPVMFFLVLIAVSYWLNPEPWHHLSLLSQLLFAGALLVLTALMIAMRRRSYLRFDERGLEIQSLAGAPRLYAWQDIESARVYKKRVLMVPVLSTIRLTLRQKARSENAARRAARSISGFDATFLAVYDESAEQILEKIQMFQRNHGAGLMQN